MKKKAPLPMTPFDIQVIPESLHMMKLLLQYLPSGIQKMLAIWIKCTELQNTIEYFKEFPYSGIRKNCSQKQVSAAEIFEELRPYMKDDEAEQIDMALSAMSMMEMMQSDEGNSADLLRSMMPSGSENMFDLYSQMFEKGGDNKDEPEKQSMGRMDDESSISESGSFETGTDEDGI